MKHYNYDTIRKIRERPLAEYPYSEVVAMLSLHHSQCDYRKHFQLRELALNELLQHYSIPSLAENPLRAGSEIAMVGDSVFEFSELKQRLQPFGIQLAKTIKDSTTHVLLSTNPSTSKGLENVHRTLMQDQDLQAALDELEKPYLKEKDKDTGVIVAQIENLLMSDNEENIWVALQLIEGGGFPKELIPAAFVVLKLTKNKKIYQQIKMILSKYLSEKTQKSLQRTMSFYKGMPELNFQKSIQAFAGGKPDLDAEKIAFLMYQYHKTGLQYLFEYAKDKEGIRKIIKQFIQGEILDLSKKDISKLPDVLVEFQDIKTVILADNRFIGVPPILLQMPNIRHLDISKTNINQVGTVLPRMQNLRHLTMYATIDDWKYLQKLVQLQQLEVLEWSGHALSPEKKEFLKMGLPNCKISFF